jgi:hypothetical protein
MPPFEHDRTCCRTFHNGLKPEMHIAGRIDPSTGSAEVLSFACATDAFRAQANRDKQTKDKSEQRKSSGSRTDYKDKRRARRPKESLSG